MEEEEGTDGGQDQDGTPDYDGKIKEPARLAHKSLS
jgi:hypothetical protein